MDIYARIGSSYTLCVLTKLRNEYVWMIHENNTFNVDFILLGWERSKTYEMIPSEYSGSTIEYFEFFESDLTHPMFKGRVEF